MTNQALLWGFFYWENMLRVGVEMPNDACCNSFKAFGLTINILEIHWNKMVKEWYIQTVATKMILGCQRWESSSLKRITTNWEELKIVHSKIKVTNMWN